MRESSRTSGTFKSRLEANPFRSLISASVAVAAVVIGIMSYWCNQRSAVAEGRYNNRISVLQNELTSLRRGVGDKQFLDIRTFLYPIGSSPSPAINSKSNYVSTEEFYAITDLPGWDHQRMSLEKFIHLAYHETFTSPTFKAMSQLPVHVWLPSTGLNVVETKNFGEVGPLIFLQKTPLDKILKGQIEALPKEIEEERKMKRPPLYASISIDELERDFRGDVAGHLLSSWLDYSLAATVNAPEWDSSLVQLQKIGNVVYAQLLRKVHDPEVNGKRVPEYFVRHEVIIITDRDDVTMIEITVPSADSIPRGPVYSTIQEWFSGLAIPVS